MVRGALVLVVVACSALPPARPRRPRPRIVGGEAWIIEQHPWLLSMQRLGHHVCGASVISLTWAMSAAQCVSSTFVNHMSVRAGSHFRDTGGLVYDAAYAIYNGAWSPLTFDYDIGLIEIKGNFTFGISIKAVGLATVEPAEGKVVIITGWGHMGYKSTHLTEEFHAVVTLVVNRTYCKARYAPLEVTERMLCAGEEQSGRDACQGDAGGPLVAASTQYGIASWGLGCGQPGYPGVYASVAALRDWIKEAIHI